jgi:hypothetical protein
MKTRRWAAAVAFAVIWVAGPLHPALSSASPASATQCSAADYNGDPRLGPAQLPTAGPVGLELRGYDRFGGLTPEQFLATYWDPTAFGGHGGWRFPPANGFQIGPDGQPVEQVLPLRPGQSIDRYGSEFGSFLAPAGLPYAKRAIPPQSLDNLSQPAACNYHLYRVLREFRVDGGPIAPGLGQPGGGVQYLLVSSLVPGAPDRINVLWLIANGYLQRLI